MRVRCSHLIHTFSLGVLNCIRAMAGYTDGGSAHHAFDTDSFNEEDYLSATKLTVGNADVAFNWCVIVKRKLAVN